MSRGLGDVYKRQLLMTLDNILRSNDGELGVAGICGGGGVTTAMVIRRES